MRKDKLQHRQTSREKQYIETVKTVMYLGIAIFFMSLSFNLFQAPNGLVTGGVTGIVLVLNGLFKVSIPSTTFIINAIFLILGLYFIGKDFFFKTILASLLFYPFFLSVIPSFRVSDDMVVNGVLGGIILGVGVVFLYLSKGSSGGTSVLARIMIKYINIPFAIALFIFDGTIIFFGFLVFGINAGVYALITTGVSTVLANLVEIRLTCTYQVLVNSQNESLASEIAKFKNIEVLNLKDGNFICLVSRKTIKEFKQALEAEDENVKMLISKSNAKLYT